MTQRQTKVEADDAPIALPEDRFPIVGVGASAGGIQALTGFFKGVAANCGVGIVIVTHLLPIVLNLASGIMLMNDGAILQGAVDEVLREDRLRALYGVAVRLGRVAGQRTLVVEQR